MLDIFEQPSFQCKTGVDSCTLKRYECDSVADCADMSDEDHCAEQHKGQPLVLVRDVNFCPTDDVTYDITFFFQKSNQA